MIKCLTYYVPYVLSTLLSKSTYKLDLKTKFESTCFQKGGRDVPRPHLSSEIALPLILLIWSICLKKLLWGQFTLREHSPSSQLGPQHQVAHPPHDGICLSRIFVLAGLRKEQKV